MATIDQLETLTNEIALLKKRVNDLEKARQVSLQEMAPDQLRALMAMIQKLLEKQKPQKQNTPSLGESFAMANKDEVMKRFYEEIEPRYSRLFARLANA